MPKRILIIGLMFCVGGLLAIFDIVYDLAHQSVNINLAVCLLPIGIGLLQGKERSRWWARFWIILGYISCALISLLGLIYPQNAQANWFDHQVRGPAAIPYVLALVLFLATILILQHILLYSEKANAFFNEMSIAPY